ncbi:hypothetical protein HELRODRAFT_161408 [Helobdella robusta]|uniref:Uncharacterized protein n=1 Tax=Helobdella robusta TaxID=6412 RepID=T1ERG2_HELRO|nr:hypothetical protein HELRODRAFT_161408 [Helobdella robusta]ESO02171.1 hypothetical protein HELRODRAFT_161408 [Helobdella robusta]
MAWRAIFNSSVYASSPEEFSAQETARFNTTLEPYSTFNQFPEENAALLGGAWASNNGSIINSSNSMMNASPASYLSQLQPPGPSQYNPSSLNYQLAQRDTMSYHLMSPAGVSLPPLSTFRPVAPIPPSNSTHTLNRTGPANGSIDGSTRGSQTGDALGKALASIYASDQTNSSYASSSSTPPVCSPPPLAGQFPQVWNQHNASPAPRKPVPHIMTQGDQLDDVINVLQNHAGIVEQDRLVQLDDAIHILRNHAEGSQLNSNNHIMNASNNFLNNNSSSSNNNNSFFPSNEATTTMLTSLLSHSTAGDLMQQQHLYNNNNSISSSSNIFTTTQQLQQDGLHRLEVIEVRQCNGQLW